MSPDQLAYVLVALIVVGAAIGALLVVLVIARFTRARRAEARPAEPLRAESAAWPPVEEAPAAARAPFDEADEPIAVPIVSEDGTARPAATVAAESGGGRRFPVGERMHDPIAESAIEDFLAIEPRRPHEGPSPDPYIDPLTGLDTLLAWERTLAEESARFVRYRRPVSVVVAELDGLTRLVDRFGADPARRVLPAVAAALRTTARRTDRVAHVGNGRFLILLPETDEIQAINYVERVRAACEKWLEAGAVALRLTVGWASPSAAGDLDTALRSAEERMYAERRRLERISAANRDPITY